MNTWLANEAVESLKDCAQMVEDEYAARGKCSFYTWKPKNIVVDKSCIPSSSLAFNMVDIDDNAIVGQTCINVSKCGSNIVLYFLITDFRNSSTFNMLYDDTVCDSIGQYIYSFVREVDMLMSCY